MHRYNEAQENYYIYRQFYIYEEKVKMVLTAFGVLMLPLNEDRRQITNCFENFLSYMQLYKERYDKITQPMVNYFYDPKKRSWLS